MGISKVTVDKSREYIIQEKSYKLTLLRLTLLNEIVFPKNLKDQLQKR